jgi:hypothetical protein
MKQLIPFVALATLMTASLTVSCKGSFEQGGRVGDVAWRLTEDGVLTISGYGEMPDFNNTIGSPDYDPTPWDPPKWPYVEASFIRKVIILDGVTSIGNDAFTGRPYLSEVTIPQSVTRIGNGAFAYCQSLSAVDIPAGVTSIEAEAFKACYSLADISIPIAMTTIAEYTFQDCGNIKTVTIPDNITTIGAGAFHGCRKIKTVTIPDNVTTIGAGAFGSLALESVTIGSGVTVIGIGAFHSFDSIPITSVSIRATTPPQLGDELNGSFVTSATSTLYVPTGCTRVYAADPAWSKAFNTIVEQP